MLQPKQWLNDAVITFYQEYLGKGLPKTVILMDPCAVAELQYSQMTGDPDKDEDLIDMFAPLKLDKADLILMPVNDNSDPLLPSNTKSNIIFYRRWHTLDFISFSQWQLVVHGFFRIFSTF